MPPELLPGARLFNAAQWWEAHEAWEEPWHTASGDRRKLLSALILLAAALHKRWHMHSTGLRNFDKAMRYVDDLPETPEGVPLRRLAAEVGEALHEGRQLVSWPQLPL